MCSDNQIQVCGNVYPVAGHGKCNVDTRLGNLKTKIKHNAISLSIDITDPGNV